MSRLTIPMSPSEFPQQRLYEVIAIPPLPEGYDIELMDYEHEHGLPGIPKKPTKKSIALAQVEWSWSPMNARVDAYELHGGKEHWMLWCGGPDENVGMYITNWYSVACMPVKGVSQQQAAVHLLLAFWEYEAGAMSLDQYHWINRAGALSVSEIQSIANVVWSEETD